MVYTQKASLTLTGFNSRTGRVCSIHIIAYFAVVFFSWEQFLLELLRLAVGLALQALPPWLQEGASLVNGLRLLA